MNRPKQNHEMMALNKQELLRLLSEDDALKHLLQTLLQEALEAEMDEGTRRCAPAKASGPTAGSVTAAATTGGPC